MVFPLGQHLDKPGLFCIHEAAHLSRHFACFGTTGSGKSNMAELLGRLFIDSYRGCCLLDPAGDLAENLAVYVDHRAKTMRSDAIRQRTHYLEVSPERVFGDDPFRYVPDPALPKHLQEIAFHAWLRAQAQRLSSLVCRVMGETGTEQKPRLTRLLEDLFVAVGTAVDAHGTHLSLSDAFVVLDPTHERHDEVYAAIEPHLPSEIRADFAVLRSLRQRPGQLLEQIESTINRMRNLLSGLTKAVFSETTKSIPWEEILTGRHIVLVNLRPTRYVSEHVGKVLGGLFFQKIRQTAELLPRGKRTRFYLLLEEASAIMGSTGEDVKTSLQQARKHDLSVGLFGQSIESFRRGPDDNTIPILLNEVGTIFCFQQKAPMSRDTLADILGTPNLSFDELYHERDRPDGYEWVTVRSQSFGGSQQVSLQHGLAQTDGVSATSQQGVSSSTQMAVGTSHSHQIGTSVSDSVTNTTQKGESHSKQHAVSTSQSEQHAVGRSTQVADGTSTQETIGSADARSNSTSESASHQSSRGENQSHTHSNASQTGSMSTTSENAGHSKSTGESASHSSSRGETAGRSASESIGRSNSTTHGETVTQSHAHSTGRSHTVTHGQSETTTIGRTEGVTDTVGVTQSTSESTSVGSSTSHSETHGRSDSLTKTTGVSTSESNGVSASTSIGQSHTQGATEGMSQSVSVQPVPLQRHRVESEPTGKLRHAISDQQWQHRQQVATLGLGEAIVLLWGEKRSVPVKFFEAKPLHARFEDFERALRDFKRLNDDFHEYIFAPRLQPGDEDRRIDGFVQAAEAATNPPPIRNGDGRLTARANGSPYGV